MANKAKKHLKAQFEQLSRPQLIALATQRDVMPYREALATSAEDLRAALIGVEGVLKPVPA
jgi:hypothetical protein